jgi:DMSO reductase anchor subunit
MVQLLIYPSFKYFNKEALFNWHNRYTIRMAFVVIPLMFSQLALTLFSCYKNATLLSCLHLILVLLAWVTTVLIFIPIHKKLSNNNSNSQLLQKLVNYNWLRVIIWNATFAVSVIQINNY